jgi:hypothetical protein
MHQETRRNRMLAVKVRYSNETLVNINVVNGRITKFDLCDCEVNRMC